MCVGRRLYSDIERIDNELRERGVAAGAPLAAPQLFAIDSLHYEGDAAVEAGIASCGLTAASAVLDIGAGLGGPARFMAHTAGCRVCAVELQADVHAKGRELTQRCGLDALVSHVCGDILSCDLSGLGDGPGSFDAVASWLTFLHIPDKHALLTSCAAMIKPGGALYAEDFFARGAFTPAEERSLSADVFCKELPTRQEYIDTLTACGFVDIVFEERTEPWTEFVDDRFRKFELGRERFVRVHSEATYDSLHHFYSAMRALFRGGNLGGVRISARKKAADR